MKRNIAFIASFLFSTFMFWLAGCNFNQRDELLSFWVAVSFIAGFFVSAFFAKKDLRPNRNDFLLYFSLFLLIIILALLLSGVSFSRGPELVSLVFSILADALLLSAIYWLLIFSLHKTQAKRGKEGPELR